MGKYDLTPLDIEMGINRLLTEAYASATVSTNPTLVYISAGPGAGKTAVESHFKRKFKENGERAYVLNSDKIAEFHPNYEKVLEELSPEEGYRITRQFVRPATPIIFDSLIKKRVSIINENTLDKGESDIELAKKVKENGYKISINIIATDLFESRLSCYEREAAILLAGLTPRGASKETQMRMYNSFVAEVQELQRLRLADEVNVYIRGENINRPPILRYSSNDDNQVYSSFYEALVKERDIQRKKLLADSTNYLQRIKNAQKTISEYGVNKLLTENSLNALQELQDEFICELEKER